MRQIHVRALAAVGVGAFALAACGSSSKASSTSGSTTPTTVAAASTTAPAPSTSATVTVATTKLGKVLVDTSGKTLYRFDNDTKPDASTCTGQCASAWPAATVTGTPVAGAGVEASKLSTFKRADGSIQLEIAGHPLYTFAGDAKPGDTNGQGVIGKWYAAGPDGDKVGDNS